MSDATEPADLDALIRSVESLLCRLGNGAASTSPSAGGGGDVAASALAQLAIAYTASALRCWGTLATMWAAALPSIGRAMAGTAARDDDGAARAVLLDELRASLRQLGALPGEEARRLQSDIERILSAPGLERRRSAPPPGAGDGAGDGPDPYWRRWEIKP
jgi:hypothetical protein